MKIVAYKVVGADEVENYIDEGWQPLGGVSHIPGTLGVSQAIVKYESGDPWHVDFDPRTDMPKPNIT